jgi:hypothetical protein
MEYRGAVMAETIAEAHAAPAAEAPATEERPAATRPRVMVGELVSAGAALLLLVIMFVTEWYGVAGVPDPSYARPAVSTAENGWNALTITRWVLVATIVVAIGSVLLHISQREHGTKTNTGFLVAGLGAVSSALLVYRVLIALPQDGKVIDQKLGAFLALLCALTIAWGGYESIREEHARAEMGIARSRRRRRLGRRGSER